MDPTGLLLFSAAYLGIVALPGPAVTALVARVLAGGTRGIPAFIAGFTSGSVIWLALAVTGLAAIASTVAPLFLAIRYGGASYLLYLAWKLWRAPVAPLSQLFGDTPPTHGRLFLTGLAINLGNPKALVFFVALLPTVLDIRGLTPVGVAELAAVITLTISVVFAAYAVAASRARRLFTSPGARRLMNRGSSMVMAGAAVSIAAR